MFEGDSFYSLLEKMKAAIEAPSQNPPTHMLMSISQAKKICEQLGMTEEQTTKFIQDHLSGNDEDGYLVAIYPGCKK